MMAAAIKQMFFFWKNQAFAIYIYHNFGLDLKHLNSQGCLKAFGGPF